jgi:hypothetical protein
MSPTSALLTTLHWLNNWGCGRGKHQSNREDYCKWQNFEKSCGYIRRATVKNLSYEQLRQLSDNEVKKLLGNGKRKVKECTESVDFAVVDLELQRKGVTLALLLQKGLDKG